MKITIKEIAAMAGVSFQAVSAVLNGNLGKVSAAKRDMIIDIAKEMGYRSNLAAKSLRTRKSYTIGILLPSPLDVFYASMVAEFQRLLCDSEYTGTFSFWSDYDEIAAATQNILDRNVDAIVTVEPSYLPSETKIPVVTYYNEDPRFDFVAYDFNARMRIVMDYLISLGHSRIGYIGRASSLAGQGFVDAAKSRGLAASANKYVFDLNAPDLPSGTEVCESALLKLINCTPRPSAIIARCDTVAFKIYQAAHKHGVKIPDDISIIGGDDLPVAKILFPSLTTIKYSEKSLPTLMLEAIFNRLKNPQAPRTRTFCNVELIIRDSCRRLEPHAIPSGDFPKGKLRLGAQVLQGEKHR